MTGIVYVIEFSTGVVKVGMSRSEGRVKQHIATARALGADAVATWESLPVPHPEDVERSLITWCSERGEVVAGREWFRGLSFTDATRYAETLAPSDVGKSEREAAADLLRRHGYTVVPPPPLTVRGGGTGRVARVLQVDGGFRPRVVVHGACGRGESS